MKIADEASKAFWIEIEPNHWVMVGGTWRVHYMPEDKKYLFASASGSFRLGKEEAKVVLAKLGLKP